MLYEYPVVARHYALSTFLLFLVVVLFPERNLKQTRYRISLFLLTISSVFTLAISIIFLFENVYSIKKLSLKIFSFALLLFGIFTIFYLYGAHRLLGLNDKFSNCVFSNDSSWSCLASLTSFYPIPEIIFQPLIVYMYLLVLISLIILIHLTKEAIFIATLLLINLPWLFYLCEVEYRNRCSWYHSVNLYVFMIAGVWLFMINVKCSQEYRKVLLIILISSGLLTAPIGLRSMYLDYSYPYSGSKDMARYIENHVPEDSIIATYSPIHTTTILAYLPKRKLYYLAQKDFVTFRDYRVYIPINKNNPKDFEQFLIKNNLNNKPMYFIDILKYQYGFEAKYLEQIYFSQGRREEFYLYKFKK